jgi:hypothetical protein
VFHTPSSGHQKGGWGMYSYNRRFGVPSWIYLGYFALLTVVTIIPLLEAIAEQFSVFAKKTHRVPLSAYHLRSVASESLCSSSNLVDHAENHASHKLPLRSDRHTTLILLRRHRAPRGGRTKRAAGGTTPFARSQKLRHLDPESCRRSVRSGPVKHPLPEKRGPSSQKPWRSSEGESTGMGQADRVFGSDVFRRMGFLHCSG